MSEQYTTDGHGLMRDGKRYAVCDTPAAAEDLARMGNSHEALVAAAQTLRCLETSPHFQGMTVAEAIAELKNNGACGDAESAIKFLSGAA